MTKHVPKIIWQKSRRRASSCKCWTSSLPNTQFLFLQCTLKSAPKSDHDRLIRFFSHTHYMIVYPQGRSQAWAWGLKPPKRNLSRPPPK